MASLNRVYLVGNLTRDPDVRQTPSGKPVAELRLAVSETYRDRQTGQPKEVVCYVDVVVWERQAELCGQYLAKGRPVLVEGRLTYDEWKTPQGEARTKLPVRADRIQFLGAPQGKRGAPAENAGDAPVGGGATQPPPDAAEIAAPAEAAGAAVENAAGDAAASGDDDDLPF
jgi:single-strand DNA-binding protein